MTTHSGGGPENEPPRSDLKDAIGWVVLGIAVLIASLRMDRLESQGINPYTIPGLLPGLLGVGLILLGATLGVRSLRLGALHQPLPPADAARRVLRKRIAIVLALVLTYGLALVGHPSLLVHLLFPGSLVGLPFWLASAIFVTATILVLRRISADPQDRVITVMTVVQAVAIAVVAALAIQLVFQDLFLVRLP
jgi:hypothetical protein